MAKLIRVLSTIILLSGGLYLYCHYAVPVLEPVSRFQKRDIITGSSDPVYRFLELLFPPDAWEIKQSRHLEINNLHILVDDYNLSAEANIEVKRCTFVIVSADQSLTETQRFQRAVIIQCTDKATLQFERPPLEGGLGGTNRFLGGMLNGEIVVFGQGDPHNPNDNLNLVTRDVHINADRIWTSANIRFSYGQSHGMGTGMQIQLINSGLLGSSLNADSSGAFFHKFERVTIQKLDHLTLYPINDSKNDTKDSQTILSFQNAPIELHCDGQFTFKLLDETATFSDNVSLIHPVPDKQPDTLLCDDLNIYFKSAAGSNRETSQKGDADTADFFEQWDLTIDRLEATGKPVIIRSPDNSLEMEGKKVLITVNPLSFELDDITGGQTVIKYKEHEIHSQNLVYFFGENEQLGALQCNSSGWIRSRVGTEGKSFRARWLERMVFAPDLQDSSEHMVSLKNKVILEFGKEGNPDVSINAPNVYFWLARNPESASSKSGGQFTNLTLKRMQAENHVAVKSDYISARVKKLQLWFEQKMDVQNLLGAAESKAGDNAGLDALFSENTLTDSESRSEVKAYYAESDLLQGKIQLASGKFNISEVTLNDNVWVYNKNENENDSKLYFKGRRLEMYNILLPHASARLSGEPAQVGFDNMVLFANALNINRSMNRVWSDCSGTCRWLQRVPVASNAEGESEKTATVPTEIQWHKSMNFDGAALAFEGDVTVTRANQNIQCGQLYAFLTNKINFQQLNSNESALDVKTVLLSNNVKLENVSLMNGKQTSLDCMVASRLSVDISGKKMAAFGPGRVTTQRKTAASGTEALSSDAENRVVTLGDKTLAKDMIYLCVDFQDRLDIDLSVPNSQNFVFLGRVESIYGSINNWGESLNSQRISDLPQDAFILKCARMDIQTNYPLTIPSVYTPAFHSENIQIASEATSFVSSVFDAADESISVSDSIQNSVNSDYAQDGFRSPLNTFVATGSVILEGRIYNATADKISYESKTDQLILEGGERTPAKFYYQKVLGGYYYQTSSVKIFYSPKTGAVHGEGIQDFSLYINTPEETENK